MVEKLKDCFEEMVVYKDLQKSSFFSALSLPAFLRDWLLKKFEDEDGQYDIEEVTDFIKNHLPRKEDWTSIKNRIVLENDRVKFLTKISVDINIKNQDAVNKLIDMVPNITSKIDFGAVFKKNSSEFEEEKIAE